MATRKTTSEKSRVKPAKAGAKKTSKPSASKKKNGKVVTARKSRTTKKNDAWLLARAVVDGILEKKGDNITCLDLRDIPNSVCDYFIICEGGSNIQVEAIAESVEEIVKKETGQKPYRSEGWENALWILIDYVDVLVHVFQRETRQYYSLERLWADAEEVSFPKNKVQPKARLA